jgi:hypothetical protein
MTGRTMIELRTVQPPVSVTMGLRLCRAPTRRHLSTRMLEWARAWPPPSLSLEDISDDPPSTAQRVMTTEQGSVCRELIRKLS